VGLRLGLRVSRILNNTAAALGIVGPALLISNVVVRAVQDARGRTSVRPLLATVYELLWQSLGTAAPVLNALGYEGPRQSHQALLFEFDFARLGLELHRTRRRIESSFAALGVGRNDVTGNIHPLVVPRFSLITRLFREAASQRPDALGDGGRGCRGGARQEDRPGSDTAGLRGG
jgi:hypothetical protein